MKSRLRHAHFVSFLLATAMIQHLPAATNTDSQSPQAINISAQKSGVRIDGMDWIVVNDNDDNNDEKWDFEVEPVLGEKDTAQYKVTANADKSPLTVKIEIFADTDLIDYMWEGTHAKDGQTTGSELDGKEKRSGKKSSFEFTIPAGKSEIQTFYLEGVKNSRTAYDFASIYVTITAPEVIIGTTKYLAVNTHVSKDLLVYQADLDVNSDSLKGSYFSGGTKEEDVIESSIKADGNWSKRPGKILMVNDGFGDDIPDWADGFDSDPSTDADSFCGAPITFIPMWLTRKDPFTENCKVKFTYSASDPTLVMPISGNGFPGYNNLFVNNANGKLRIWKKNNDGTKRNKMSVISGGDYVADGVEIPWENLSDGEVAHLWVEAVRPSASLADLSVIAEVSENNAKASDKVNFTAVKITAEPIDKRPDSGFYPINPSGVVSGEPGKFKIEVLPDDYPDAEIRWIQAAGGGILTPETGRSVRLDNAGNAILGIFAHVFGEYYNELPRFRVNTYSGYQNVDVHAFVVSGIPVGKTTRVHADAGISLATVISKLNESHRQLGVHYNLASVEYLDTTFDSYFNCTKSQGETLVNHPSTSGGIEMYVVDNSLDPDTGKPSYAGINYPDRGLIVITNGYSPSAVGLIAAHEIGHEGGLKDLYYTKEFNETTMTFGMYRAFEIWNVQDWPAGSSFASDPSYYSRIDVGFGMNPTRQKDLIERQVMHGVAVGDNIDFASGRVRGVGGGYRDDPLSIRDGKVGIIDFDGTALIHH